MSTGYGHTNIDDLEDLRPKFGMGELGEARYVREDVGAEGIGISHYRMNPGKRTGFGHRHKEAEEMYVVVERDRAGSRSTTTSSTCEARDVVRVAPAAVREFEAGPDGMEVHRARHARRGRRRDAPGLVDRAGRRRLTAKARCRGLRPSEDQACVLGRGRS